jgi:polyribonucleotide nucleotidyltransferase
VKPDQIRLVIGPGGKTIKGIVDQTGVAIDVEDDGTVNIASSDPTPCKRAIDIIKGLTAEPEVGADLQGHGQAHRGLRRLRRDPPRHRGLVHVSRARHERVENVEDVVKEGDTVDVKVLSVEDATARSASRAAS